MLLEHYLVTCIYSLSPSLFLSQDLVEDRLKVAKEMGADHTIQITAKDSREMSQIITGQMECCPDKTIECSGAEPSIATAIYVGHTIDIVFLVIP